MSNKLGQIYRNE